MEREILERLCPGKRIIFNRNGKDVKISVMAKRIASLIHLWNNKYYPIVILVDLEDRKITNQQMAQQLEDCLIKEGIRSKELIIGVADQMTENWIIADWERLTGNIKGKPANTDGNNGSTVIKKIKGRSYGKRKTTDGVKLFLAARPEVMYANSPSYRAFVDQLTDIECPHLRFLKKEPLE